MKTFIVGFLGVAFGLFFAPSFCYSQDTLVCIQPSTARYFLEMDDIATTLTKEKVLNQQQIQLLETKLTLKDSLISSYKQDSVTNKQLNETFQSEITLNRRKLLESKRNARLTRIASGIVIILILILK
jgi:hypothetical protein